jgi:uncharacterized protein (DUF1800 family)
MSEQAIAANRFGFGARPADVLPASPRFWLANQLKAYNPKPAAFAGLATRADIAATLADYMDMARSLRKDMTPSGQQGGVDADPAKEARRMVARAGRDHYTAAVGARFRAAMASETPFVERLVTFWANHFAVSADKLPVVGLSGMLEIEAIRPNVLGRFSDMLIAVEQHPAMLLYLDQAQSIGPDSPIGSRITARGKRKVGLNENLAREIMELHTLGVRTGYGQADVTEFARALTGWTVSGIAKGPIARQAGVDGRPGDFAFAGGVHEPGTRTIMGRTYRENGVGQAGAILGDLAASPATARHIATKLARHFASDEPPAALVARLEQAFLETRGDLPSLYGVLIDAPEIWAANAPKFKTPWDWAVSSFRALAVPPIEDQLVVGLLNQLGQPVWKPGSPAGYDDIAVSWAGPDALFRRVEAAERIALRAPGGSDPRRIAEHALPGAVSAATAQAIDRAESPTQGLALLVVSPEFLRR